MDNIEKQFEEIEGRLYQINHFPSYMIPTINDRRDVKDYWNSIKDNKELLEWATTVRKDKWGQKDTFNGTTICESMLIDYKDVDKEEYASLVSKIYSNKDLARIVLKGASNGGWSLLLLALQNKEYVLTEQQKAFALDEAMNMHGTTRYSSLMDEFEQELDNNNVTDEDTVIVDFGSGSHPVGKKSCVMYMKNVLNELDCSQAHGRGSFDIRYHILRNPNWTEQEKMSLVHEFWADDEEYTQTIDDWEWEIVNDSASFLPHSHASELDFYELYTYSREDLMAIYKDEKIVNYILGEIDFCRTIKEYRPEIDLIDNDFSF